MFKKRAPHGPEITAGLQQIDEWGTWFRDAHEARLRALQLPPAQFEAELAECQRLGVEVTAQLKREFLQRQQRQSQ